MDKPNKYFDIAILLLLCYTSAVAIYYHNMGVSDFTISNYLGFIFLAFTILSNIIFPNKVKPSVLILLCLGTFNIASFTLYRFTAAIGYGDSAAAVNIINPIMLILLIVYLILNRQFLRSYYKKNDRETLEEESELVDFYYKKFTSCSSNEFSKVLAAYEQYPLEAQKAIDKLIVEKR